MSLPPTPGSSAIADGKGRATSYFLAWCRDLLNVVATAAEQAGAAAPAATNIVASGGLRFGGALSGEVGLAFYAVIAATAALPAHGNAEGDWAYARDGRKPGEGAGLGSGTPCFWSNGAWIAVTSGAQVTS